MIDTPDDTDDTDPPELVRQEEPPGDTDAIGLLRQADPVDDEEVAPPKDSPIAQATFEEITDIPYNEND
jgi:hypothetical protein